MPHSTFLSFSLVDVSAGCSCSCTGRDSWRGGQSRAVRQLAGATPAQHSGDDPVQYRILLVQRPPCKAVRWVLVHVQCDILRPGRLPAVLVGNGRLGGISATIAAVEVSTNDNTTGAEWRSR